MQVSVSLVLSLTRSVPKVTEADGVSPMKGETLEHARNSQIADNHSDFRFRRLEMPLFDGTNPDEWVMKTEQYFILHWSSN